jgi:peptidoglycan/xylan/chitin deacetylase (PgdA/CDA1 family)
MYHKVKNFNNMFKYENFVSVKNFRENINFLKKYYSIVNCFDMFNDEIKNSDKKIFLTFDDGLRCHFDYVYKILKDNNINAIFYICNLPLEKKKILTVHKIHLILAKFKSNHVIKILHNILERKMLKYSPANYYSYQNLKDINNEFELKRILNYQIKNEFRDYVVNKLFNFFFYDISEKNICTEYYLSYKEIKEMSRNNMIIGSHTDTHPVLTNLEESEWKKELSESVNKFSEYNPDRLKTFCYPYGVKKTYNKKMKEFLNNMDVSFSVIAEDKNITNKDLKKNRQELPRFDCSNFFQFEKS